MKKHNLGSMIDYFRRANDMTLEDLGRKLSKSPSAISRWISEDRSPMVEDLIRLTEIFDTDIETLMYGSPNSSTMEYPYYNGSVAAGIPVSVEGASINDLEKIEIPNHIMGKYAGSKDIIFLRVNGESMNKVIPNGSLIAIKPWDYTELKKNDIVVFSDNNEFSMKRFLNDEKNQRFIFRPDSTNDQFTDIIVDYDDGIRLKLVGKVVLSIVNYD